MNVSMALYDLMLRTQFSRARAATLGALGLIGIVIGVAVGAGQDTTFHDRVLFVDSFGLTLVLPVTCLVFASAALGDLIEDQTMVYLTVRPVARAKIALSAIAATLSIVIPLVALPLTAAGAAARLDVRPLLGVALATVIGAIEYTAVFTLAGVLFRRALTVGLVYIFIWEQFVARASRGVRRFTISAYTRSILGHISRDKLRDADMTLPLSVVIPLIVAGIAAALTTARLRTQDTA